MDRSSSSPDDPKWFRVVREMMLEKPTRNVFYLFAFAETLALIDGERPFRVEDIARVISAWGSSGDGPWIGGFVLRLRDGRRFYVESHEGSEERASRARISAEEMLRDSASPALPKYHHAQLCRWTDNVPELNELLTRIAGR